MLEECQITVLRQTTSILKPPSKLPKQYSGNEAKASVANVLDDDDPETKDTIRLMLSRCNDEDQFFSVNMVNSLETKQ